MESTSQVISLASSPVPVHNSAFAGGLSNPTTTHYRHRRHVLDIVNRLHSYGLQELDLPQIAVVGSQSVGKSSLIESISGITLPRAKGTCTRCPIECRLSKVQRDWACEVFLRRQGHEIRFGSALTDNSGVEERIRRAQLAILNPSTPPLDFLLSSSTPSIERNEVSFSKDLISVRISGREVDDLSFVDLPGIIQSVRDDGRERDIVEVEELVTSFIQKPSCLILLVVSCETDLENQGARRLAKQVDRSGNRTIPVLTKPDRIAVGEHSSWVRLLENQQERFKPGWHCVKQPNQEQLDSGVSWNEARRNEAEFFENTTPWTSLEESIKSRLGTKFLTESLGTILFDLISKRLPGLFNEVEAKLQYTKKCIGKLPDKPQGDPVAAVWKMIAAFKKDVTQLIAGRPEDGVKGPIQIFRKSKEQFREAIFGQAPDFQPFDRPRCSAQHIEPGIYRSNSFVSYEESREYSSHPPPPSPPTVHIVLPQTTEGLEPVGFRNPKTLVYLDEVIDMAQNAITRELPHNYPYAVKKHYISRFTQDWPVPAKQLFDRMERKFSKELRALVVHHFSSFSAGGLEAAVLRTILAQLKERSTAAQEKMRECIELEFEEPVTSNEHYLADYKEKFVGRYKAARSNHIRPNTNLQRLVDGGFQNTSTMRDVLQNLRDMGLTDADHKSLLRLIPPDLADDAIEIMAEVRAYYQVAFKRFVDYIPMIIDFQLLKGFDRTLDDALFKGLSLGENEIRERCTGYLQEDPSVLRRRQSLQQDLERFEAALSDLQNIPGISFSVYDSDDDGLQSEEDDHDFATKQRHWSQPPRAPSVELERKDAKAEKVPDIVEPQPEVEPIPEPEPVAEEPKVEETKLQAKPKRTTGASSGFSFADPPSAGGSAFTSPFASPPKTESLFGSSGRFSFGGFGAGAGSGTSSAFGTTGTFGQPAANNAAAGTNVFGGAFGGGAFGANTNSAGGKPATQSGFGAIGTTTTPQGTASPPFSKVTERDSGWENMTIHYQSISCMPQYIKFSPEELRVQDYAVGRKNANSNVPAAPSAAPQVGGFGGATLATTGFGMNEDLPAMLASEPDEQEQAKPRFAKNAKGKKKGKR